MATRLPGMYGVSEQDSSLLSHLALPADPAHGKPGASERQVPGKDAPKYPSQIPTAEPLRGMHAGASQDRTPRTHAAPSAAWATMEAGEAGPLSRWLHSLGFSQARMARHEPGRQMPIMRDQYNTPGQSVLAPGTPGQLRTGSPDVAQGRGVPNRYGFGEAHVLRWTTAGSSVPTAFSGSAERPIRMIPGAGLSQRIRHDSRYALGGASRMGPGQIQAVPTPYVQPPNPATSPATGYPRQSGFTFGG